MITFYYTDTSLMGWHAVDYHPKLNAYVCTKARLIPLSQETVRTCNSIEQHGGGSEATLASTRFLKPAFISTVTVPNGNKLQSMMHPITRAPLTFYFWTIPPVKTRTMELG